jgi:hypothetical protein
MLVYERDTIVPAPSAVNKQSEQGTTQQEDMDIDSNSNDNGPVQQLEDEVKLLLHTFVQLEHHAFLLRASWLL